MKYIPTILLTCVVLFSPQPPGDDDVIRQLQIAIHDQQIELDDLRSRMGFEHDLLIGIDINQETRVRQLEGYHRGRLKRD